MRSFFFFLFILPGLQAYSQPKCPCDKIGVDAQWADSNKVDCYLIPVPRSDKSKATFNLAVVKVNAVKNPGKEPLLYLHGGPGIATLGNVQRYVESKTWAGFRQERDLIFFDYRGTGYSEPVICPWYADSLNSVYGQPVSAAEKESRKLELVRKCRTESEATGIDIATFSSFQNAEDADHIRRLLGIERWNVYGVSHGTTVALNLLRNHEEHISAMILDSPFPPNAPWPDFVRPFAESFKVLEKNIAADKFLSKRFPDLHKYFVDAVNNLNKEPYKIKINDQGAEYPVTGNDFAWSVWSAMLKPAALPFVALAIEEASKGNYAFMKDWGKIFSSPDQYGKFSELQSKAVLCYEGRPKNESDSKASLQKNYPDFQAFNIDFEGDFCNAWQPSPAPAALFSPVVSKKPVLILSGEYDPVCPPMFGELTAKTLSNSTFINVPASSHAAIHADECMVNMANAFIDNPGKPVNTSCVAGRQKIKFITGNLVEALAGFK